MANGGVRIDRGILMGGIGLLVNLIMLGVMWGTMTANLNNARSDIQILRAQVTDMTRDIARIQGTLEKGNSR